MKALEIKDLKKVYSNRVEALKGISLSVEVGDFFALLGPNGAGKSTTIGIITSLVRKTCGYMSIYGYDIDHEFAKAKACLGVVPQEFNFNVFETCLDVLIYQAGYYGVAYHTAKKRALFYLEKLGLHKKANTIVKNLSGGMKRRLMIARALIHQPKMLILDEPTAGVDVELRHLMWNFLQEINKQNVTIILTTHYLEEAEHLCRNIAIINEGRLVECTSMATLLKKLEREYYILDVTKTLDKAPTVENYDIRLLDSLTLEVGVGKQHSLNELFAILQQQNITITSMRNKSNRLEELFLKLTTDRQ